MSNFLKKVFSILSLLLLAFLNPSLAFADYIVTVPGPNLQLAINKLVQDPRNGQFVDGLSSSNFAFLPGHTILFRLEVKNNGQQDLNNIQVKDVLPGQLEFVSGPGSFDKGTRTISFTIDSLKVGETKSFDIKAKVSGGAEAGVCVTNFAEARKDSLVSQDTAVICIQKKVLGAVTQLPVTGVDLVTLTLSGSTLMFLTSLYLLRKAKI